MVFGQYLSVMNDTLLYLYSLRNRGSSFGIERIRKLLPLLGNPQNSFPVIHVAGTNGKGSVCSMLDSIYRENGYKVGLSSSPHLVELGERIRVDGEILTLDRIEKYVRLMKPIADKMELEKAGSGPTFFELMTAMAFLVFAEQKVDLAILETGLGGRLDSTNVVEPKLSIITTIALDHCSILGNSIEEIAREKAGIIKQGVPIITGWLPDAAKSVVEGIADSKSSPFESMAHKLGIEFPETNLVGRHQKRNAALAYYSVLKIENLFPVTEEKIRKGLTKVKLEGRWQYIEGSPAIILDACHNQEGAVALQENLRDYGKSVIVWLGALGEDRATEVINAVVPFAEEIRLFEIKQPRACSISNLKKLVPKNFRGIVSEGTCENFSEQLKEVNKASTIVITGSIYLVGDLLSQIRGEYSHPLGHRFQDLL